MSSELTGYQLAVGYANGYTMEELRAGQRSRMNELSRSPAEVVFKQFNPRDHVVDAKPNRLARPGIRRRLRRAR